MPVMRYFLFVGAALLALLFVAGEAFPTLPAAQVADSANTAADLPMIRIQSDRKWPERVVFDTSVPALVPAQTQVAKNEAGVTASAQVAANSTAESSTKVTARDAFAQLVPSDLKKPGLKPQQKRKVAKKHVAPPTMMAAQRPQFGLFANNIW